MLNAAKSRDGLPVLPLDLANMELIGDFPKRSSGESVYSKLII